MSGGGFSQQLRTMIGLAAEAVQCKERSEVQLQQTAAVVHPFRVATFNVLADGLAQSGDFFKVPISCLMWEHRLPLILQEVRAANADILCLQELNHFDTLAAALVPEGYSCFFRAKKPSPALKFGFPADGIALFYRHSRFSASPAPSGHCFASMDGQPAAQGFVTALLHDKQSGRSLLVAATHLKAKAGVDNEQTRVHQACQLLQELENVQERQQLLQLQQQPAAESSSGASSSRGVPPAVLLCGDFNTTPDSETVQVIMDHRLGLQSIWNVPWSKGSSAGSNSNGNVHSHGSSSNGTAAASANGNGHRSSSHSNGNGKSSNGNGAHPPDAAASQAAGAAADDESSSSSSPQPATEGTEFTTWKFRSTGAVKRTIDYIWYSQQQLAPVSRWRMLSESEIGPEGLPSKQYPSDHMCVTCQFGWLEQ